MQCEMSNSYNAEAIDESRWAKLNARVRMAVPESLFPRRKNWYAARMSLSFLTLVKTVVATMLLPTPAGPYSKNIGFPSFPSIQEYIAASVSLRVPSKHPSRPEPSRFSTLRACFSSERDEQPPLKKHSDVCTLNLWVLR